MQSHYQIVRVYIQDVAMTKADDLYDELMNIAQELLFISEAMIKFRTGKNASPSILVVVAEMVAFYMRGGSDGCEDTLAQHVNHALQRAESKYRLMLQQ
jgi:hypothetical protein